MMPLISPEALASAVEGGKCLNSTTRLPELPAREENASLLPNPLRSSPPGDFLSKASSTRESRLSPCTLSLAALGGHG